MWAVWLWPRIRWSRAVLGSDDVVGEVAEVEGGAAQMLEATIHDLGGLVAG